MQWEAVIGLEVHVQLATKSKIFSNCSTTFGAKPNSQICPIDIGLPGSLPVLNESVVRMAILFGLSVQANIAKECRFARKNYFYPDLPKGYQITQFEQPIISGGYLNIPISTGSKRVNLTRAHLEEDAGKSLHEDFHGMTGVDLNRAGTPLLEIVSEPELRSSQEAVSFLKTLHNLVKYLEICDGNLEQGSFRSDVNISVRQKGQTTFGTRVEIKNLNSFKFVEKAIEYEIERQIDLLEGNQQVIQETRLFSSDKNQTVSMRTKEEAEDYRYFPEPDLLPLEISEDYIRELKQTLPELPQAKQQRFIKQYQLSSEQAQILVNNKLQADYFESVCAYAPNNPKLCANWIITELNGALNKANLSIEKCPVQPLNLAQLINHINSGNISNNTAKKVFGIIFDTNESADAIIEKNGLKQVNDLDFIQQLIKDVIANNPIQVKQYQDGKEKVIGYLVGQVMKASKGKLNPKQVNQLLCEKLKN